MQVMQPLPPSRAMCIAPQSEAPWRLCSEQWVYEQCIADCRLRGGRLPSMQLGYRFAHVLRRMLPIALHLLAKEGAGLTGHDLFLKRVGACFHAFVEEVESATRARWGFEV